MKYHMGWIDSNGNPVNSDGGKFLRATLCLLACEATGDDFKKALPAAAAIELVHNFSLVHDDIQDGDGYRRHRPTVWSIWGKPQAINVGSAMRVLASLSIYGLKKYFVPLEKQIEVLQILDKSCLSMIEGQFLDIDYENNPDVTVDSYIKMIEKKTAALIEGALQLGAVLNVDSDKLLPFKRFGRYLGLAFQIKDDILGIWGDKDKTGKPTGNDIKKRKKSFPIIFGLQKSDEKIRKNFIKIYNKKIISQKNLNKILMYLDKLKAYDCSERKSKQYYMLALNEIEALPISSDKADYFRKISRFLVERDF